MSRLWLPLLGAVLLCTSTAAAADSRSFATEKPWTRWWWPGSAVDEANLTRELESLAAAGIGGVEITPIYGAKGYEERYVEFLSPRWMELLAHTGREAQRLGLGVDMATGTGWPFGGKWVAPEDGIQKLVHVDGQLAGALTRMQVKRAAPGAEGPVVDPLSPAALQRYLAPFSEVFASFPRDLVRAQFHDSFEYYESGWTAALPEKFRAMHGYDIQDYAALLVPVTPGVNASPNPAHTTGSGTARPADANDPSAGDDTLRRVKSDYRATLAQLHLEYLQTWVAWSRERGWLVRNQSHGAPANLLDLYGAVDIPETETFGSTPFPIPGLRRDAVDVRSDQDLPDSLVIKMASSAAHVMGRPLASSETCTWLREHWKVALAFTKPEIDRLFVDGINHILYHGTVYSPADAAWPGWLFYASTQFNDRNPWWNDFAALNAYVTRVQTVLQSGKPDNDVLLYWPFHDVIDEADGLMKQYGVHNIGWLRDSPCGRLAQLLTDEGFSWDYISDAQLQQSQVEGGAIVTPGGTRYRALVIPATRRMPVATLSHLLALQQGGAGVIYETAPEDVPGLGHLEERRAQFRDIRDGIAKSGSVVGKIVDNLVHRGAAREGAVDVGLRFIRRTSEQGFSYFFTNLSDGHVNRWVTLGRDVRTATLVDPVSGREGAAGLRHPSTGGTQIFMPMLPGESRIVHAWTNAPDPASPREDWGFDAIVPPSTIHLTGPWHLSFLNGGPAMPASVDLPALGTWTDLNDEAAKSFAGTARYRIEFLVPEGIAAHNWVLDLGDVRESARVRVNGVEIATLWSLPYLVRVGEHLNPGTNVLEVDVTNLAANRIRDLDRRGVDWKIMREINFVNINYRRFDASQWPLTPSGLLGPVTLTPLRTLDPQQLP